MEDATCQTCGTRYKRHSNRQKYCSAECRHGRAVCKGCGVEFQRTGTVKDQKYCSTACWYATDQRTVSPVACLQCGAKTRPPRKYCSPKCASEGRRALRQTTTCQNCGEVFEARASTRRKYCSRKCAGAKLTKRNHVHSLPEGTRRPEGAGYIRIKTASGWLFEHRYVMEQELGRELEPHERIHHKNGVRDDNRPENLELWKVRKKDPAGVRASDYHCAGCRCFEG